MLEILTNERTAPHPMPTRLMFWTALAIVSVFFVFMTLPLILDQQYWFLEYPKGMHYSFSNINEYVWGEGRDINGRFSIIKLYVVYVYTLLGIRLAPTLHISIHDYRAVIDVSLFIALFWALNFFLKGLRFRISREFKYLSSHFIRQITIVTALVFGTFANLRWVHNGLTAYTILTYPPVILSLVFASAVMRLLRTEIQNGHTLRSFLKLVALAAVIAFWSNWYYELSTATIVTITGAIILEWRQHRESKALKFVVRHIVTYGTMFMAIFIPTRIWSANECARSACYEGLKLSPSTMPITFVENILNPLPFIGVNMDLTNPSFHDWAKPMVILLSLTVGVLSGWMLFQNIKTPLLHGIDLSRRAKYDLILRISCVPVLAGTIGALIMSLSERAGRLVMMGNPYRHTPATWLGYALLIALFLIFFFPRKPTIEKIFVVLLISLATISTASHYFNVNLIWNTPLPLLTRELYPLLLEDSFPGARQDLSCALVNSIDPESDTAKKFIPLANAYSQWKLQRDFCDTQ